MLISRTPLRISIGGGGTDLPSYYQRFGGFFISAAIDKHIFVAVNRTFRDDYFLKYSALERANTVDEIEHPIIREAIRMLEIGPSIEVVSLADIPAGTGLGSSGSFTVGLLNALYAYRRENADTRELAEEACYLEMDVLGNPVGKQDQYIAAFGGLTCFEVDTNGKVSAKRLAMDNDKLHELEDNLLMFFTGYSRSSGEMLHDQKSRSEKDDGEMLDNLHFIKDLGLRIKDTLERGDITGFGGLMHEHWLHKRKRSQGMSNACIDRWYQTGRANGAIGGKLIGAGGGGFLMFLAEDRQRLRQAMAAEGLQEVRFQFDHDGATTLVRT